MGGSDERNQTGGCGKRPHNQIADVTVSLLSFPSGVNAHVFVSWLHPFKEQKLIVVGDRQMAVFDDVEEKEKLLLYPHSIEWKNHVTIGDGVKIQNNVSVYEGVTLENYF